MPRPKRRVETALRQKGFRQDDSDHHKFWHESSDGTKTGIRTLTSHGTARSKKDISDNLLSQMAQQCHLTNREFRDLVDCPMTQEDYERLLHERDVL